jgi:DNA-directed RNA polymerase specialized sigma24 family protein
MTATPAEPAGSRRPGIRADGKHHHHGPRPAEPIGRAITGRDVRAALATLNVEHRRVIIEIYYHNRSVRETADLLCIPVATVASRAYSAIRQLLRAVTAVRQLSRALGTPTESFPASPRAWRGHPGTGSARFGGP